VPRRFFFSVLGSLQSERGDRKPTFQPEGNDPGHGSGQGEVQEHFGKYNFSENCFNQILLRLRDLYQGIVYPWIRIANPWIRLDLGS
jgi:hypothetical protein